MLPVCSSYARAAPPEIAVMCTIASPPVTQKASAGQRESPLTPSKRIVSETSSMRAVPPGASSKSRLRGTVGPVKDSSHAAASRQHNTSTRLIHV
jgi:hypothetical protein